MDRISPFLLSWSDNWLTIEGQKIPGGPIRILYLEAFCRPGAHNRLWDQTVIPHRTVKISKGNRTDRIVLKTVLSDGVEVDHLITANEESVCFYLTCSNPTDAPSIVQWAQPCIRVDRFTGGDQETYLSKCFVFIGGKLTRMPTPQWATQALYTPGQVWRSPGSDRKMSTRVP